MISYVDDTGHNPGLHCRQTLGLRGVGSDRVEDVDQDEEQGDQQGHPTWEYFCIQRPVLLPDVCTMYA